MHRTVLDAQTLGNGSPDFWNGLHLPAWDREEVGGSRPEDLARRREASLLESMKALQRVHLKVEGNNVRMFPPG